MWSIYVRFFLHDSIFTSRFILLHNLNVSVPNCYTISSALISLYIVYASLFSYLRLIVIHYFSVVPTFSARFVIIWKFKCSGILATGEVYSGSYLFLLVDLIVWDKYMTSYRSTNILLQWFNDVHSTDISDKCEDVLSLLSKNHGCEVSHQDCIFSIRSCF